MPAGARFFFGAGFFELRLQVADLGATSGLFFLPLALRTA